MGYRNGTKPFGGGNHEKEKNDPCTSSGPVYGSQPLRLCKHRGAGLGYGGAANGITNGYADGSFKPLVNCLREHIVTFVYRYDQKYN